MSADGIHDWEADEASPVRDASRAPGLAARAENAGLGRAFGELASENAELYRRNTEQTKRIDHLEAQLKLKDDRFEAWAREMAWREETMKSRIEQLEHSTAEKQDAGGIGGGPERRVGAQAAPEKHEGTRGRHKFSNEFIGIGVAVGGGVLTTLGELIGTTTATDIAGLVISALGIFGAGIPWYRKHREDRNADRPEG